MRLGLDVKTLQKFQAKLDNFAKKFPGEMKANDDKWAQELLEEVKRRASGRPGPNIVTGRYIAAFMLVDGRVVNPSPQTRRLEYGYSGIDRSGRRYNQPAYPHFRPALAAVAPRYRASIPVVVWRTWEKA